MGVLRVAAVQLTAVPDTAASLALVTAGIAAAADAGAALVVLPEASMTPFGSDLAAAAEPLDGRWADGVRAAAAAAGVTAVVGMFEPAGDGRVSNVLLVTGPGVEARYRKVHLFDAFGVRESDTVAAGSELVCVDVAGVPVGLATCYDLRFPQQFRELARRGATVVAVPASWGAGPGKEAQWDLLTRARAADSVSWVVAADQAFAPPRRSAPLGVGRSVVVDPTGAVRAQLGAEPGLLVTDVDPDLALETRERVPVLDQD